MKNNVVSLSNYASEKNKMKYSALSNLNDLELLQEMLKIANIESRIINGELCLDLDIFMPAFVLTVSKVENDLFEIYLYKNATFTTPSRWFKFKYNEVEAVCLQIEALVECYSEGINEGKHLQRVTEPQL